MAQFIVYFPEVTQDPSMVGTDKIGVDVDGDVRVSPGGVTEFSTIDEIIADNPEQLAYGTERVELVDAQTSFGSVSTTYMTAETTALFESRIGPEMLYVEGKFGQTIPVVPFEGTREEFDQITSGFEVATSLDVVVDVYGAENIHSGTIVLQGEPDVMLEDIGVNISELTLPLQHEIEAGYEDQLAAAREWAGMDMDSDMDFQLKQVYIPGPESP